MEYNSIYDVKKAWLEALGGDPSPATNDYEVSLLLLDWYLNHSGSTCERPINITMDVAKAISAYTGSYEWVYDKSAQKWYAKNNLNEYEEYGILPTVEALSATTSYEGKLVILSGLTPHEYEFVDGEWNDLGEVNVIYGGKFDGASYFDTGLPAKNNMCAEFTVVPTQYSEIFGSRRSSNTYGFTSFIGEPSNLVYVLGSKRTTGYTGSAIFNKELSGKLWLYTSGTTNTNVKYGAQIKIDGSNVHSSTGTTNGANYTEAGNGYNMAIGALNSVGTVGNYNFKGTLKSIKFYEDIDTDGNGTLTHDYTFKEQDGVVKMYDKVTDTYFVNQGSGSVTLVPISFEPIKDYTEKDAPIKSYSAETYCDLYLIPNEKAYIGLQGKADEDNYVINDEAKWEYREYPVIDYDGLIFTSLEADSTVAMVNYQNNAPAIEISYDGENWETWNYSAITLGLGEQVAMRATSMGSSSGKRSSFVMTGNIKASGNIMSMYDGGACTATTVPNNYFLATFASCTALSDVTDLSFPATSFGRYSYVNMFSACTITTAPNLPAKNTTYSETYGGMFKQCHNLSYVWIMVENAPVNDWMTEVAENGTIVKSTAALWDNGIPSSWTVKYSGQTEASISSLTASTPASISTTIYVQTDSFAGNSWEITECPAWCTLSTTAKTGDSSEIVVAADFNTGTSRSGNIVISATDRTITIPVSQAAFVQPAWESAITFTSQADGSSVGMNAAKNAPCIIYSTDGGQTYTEWNYSAITLDSGDTVSMCGYGLNSEGWVSKFTVNGQVKVSGKIVSLIDGGRCTATTVNDASFSNIFNQATGLTDASELILTTGTIKTHTYINAFAGCTSLTGAPVLLGTVLRMGSYENMFNGCINLNKIITYADNISGTYCINNWLKNVSPTGDFYNLGGATYPSGNSGIPSGWTEHTSLPYSGLTLTALENGCTIGASGNASLIKSTNGKNWDAWDMSNITLNSGESVYFASSFVSGERASFIVSGSVNAHGNVMSLIDNGACTATTMHEDGLRELFSGCTGLETSGLTLPATTLAEQCYWCMFAGCTSLTKAPELPATTLETRCYYNMFSGCTSLTEAPVLPATNLADVCYEGMFRACTSLNKIVTYASGTIGYKTMKWLDGASPTGDFYNLGGATFLSGVDGIPDGWTEHNSL